MSKHVSHLSAILYALMAYTLWTLGDSLMKLVGQAHVPIWQIIALMSIASSSTIILISARRRRLQNLLPKRYGLETLRAFVTLGLAAANIISFTHLPLTNVYVVVFLAPMLIALFAAWLMHEHVSWHIGGAIVVGFVGVMIAINPAKLNPHGGELIGYMALPFCLILYVSHMLMMRFAGRTEHTESMACYPQLVRVVVLLPVCLWNFHPMPLVEWLYLAGLGILSALGWLLLSTAIKQAPAATVTPFQYTQIVSGALLGYLIWGDVPSWNMVIGASIIVVSGIYMARHTHRARRLTDQPLPA